MKKLSVGPCPICNLKIWRFKRPPIVSWSLMGMSLAWRKVPYEQNQHGTHFYVLLTDGSMMRIAICKYCLLGLNDEKVKNIFADIIYTKLEALKSRKIPKDKKYKLFNHIRGIEVYRWSANRQLIKEMQSGQKYRTA